MTRHEGPRALDDGYTIDPTDTAKYDWTIDIAGKTFTVANQTQTSVYQWVVKQVTEDYVERYEHNFNTAIIEEAEWRDGVIHGRVQASWWQNDPHKPDTQFLSDRMVYFTAKTV